MSKFCNHCGASVGEEDRFCTVCGKPITAEGGAEQPKAPHAESQKKEELDRAVSYTHLTLPTKLEV